MCDFQRRVDYDSPVTTSPKTILERSLPSENNIHQRLLSKSNSKVSSVDFQISHRRDVILRLSVRRRRELLSSPRRIRCNFMTLLPLSLFAFPYINHWIELVLHEDKEICAICQNSTVNLVDLCRDHDRHS